MSDDKITVQIGADASGVESGMKAASSAVTAGTAQMKAAVEGLNAAFEAAMAPLMAFVAVMKGGQFIGEAMQETVAMTKEAGGLGKQLGISANEAGQLAIALNMVHATTEQFSAGTTMLTRQLRANEDGLKALGLETRNSDGSLRNSKDLMMDAIQILKGFKEGTDRNVAAQILFGRGAASLGSVLKLNNEIMEESKKKQEALGITITTEGQQRVAKYRDAMTEMGEVMKAIHTTIGNAMMPLFTSMGQWFGEQGPTLVKVFKGAMQGMGLVISYLIDVVKELWTGCTEVFNTIASLAEDLIGKKATSAFLTWQNALRVLETVLLGLRGALIVFVGAASNGIAYLAGWVEMGMGSINRALRGDFAGAQAAWNAGFNAMEARVAATAARVKSELAGIGVSIADVWSGKAAPKEHLADERHNDGNTADPDAGKDKGETRIKQWEAELAALKLEREKEIAVNGSAHLITLADEAAFWDKKRQLAAEGSKERIAADQRYYTVAFQASEEAFAAQVQREKNGLELFKANQAARLKIVEQIADEIGHRYGTESKQFAEAQAEVLRVKRALADQIKAVGDEMLANSNAQALAEVDMCEAAADRDLQLGQINQAKKLELERQFIAERFAINLRGIQERLAAMKPEDDPQAYAKTLAQKLELERKYQADRTALATKQAVEANKYQAQAVQGISQSWGQALGQMATGQANFATTIRSMWQGLVGAIGSAISHMFEDWISEQLTAILATKGQKTLSAISQITSYAGIAGAAAIASTAAIPIVGPAMAPAAGAAAAAAAMGFMPTAAAAKGFDIPKGVNPVTQLHQEEMVLPASLANGVRDMISGGGGGRAPSVNVHVTAWDGRSVQQWMDNGGNRQIADAVARAQRNGWRPK
jgi:hypothetical protein